MLSSSYAVFKKKEADVKKNPVDILDFFLIIPGKYLDPFYGDMKFQERLNYINDVSSKQVVVDTKNAYLHLTEFITEMSVKQAMTYFVKADKSKLIGVSSAVSGCEGPDDCGLAFFEYKGGKFTDVTSKVFPKLSIELFCADADKKLITAKMNKAMKYKVELPHEGTECVVYPLGIGEVDNGLSPSEYETFLKIEQNFPYKKVLMVWNMAAGKFEFGKKVK